MSEPGLELVKPGSEPGSEEVVPRVAEQVIMGSRLDRHAVEVTIQTHERIDTHLNDIRSQLEIEKLRDPISRQHKWPTHDDWYTLAKDVCRLKLSVEKIITQARVSRDEPWELYQLALSIRERWVRWRREEAHRTWEEQSEESKKEFDDVLLDFGVPELEESWSRIIAGLRWLTSHTKATLL
jgi:hypothetical protein